MATKDDIYCTLEDMLCNQTGKPLRLSLHFLQSITKDFSEANLIGHGGFGDVYKGVLEDGIVAVKKLHPYQDLDGKSFLREVDCLMRIRHHNIVWFVGYCAETQEEFMLYQGENIFVVKQERLLCFEYLHKGNLRKYLSEEPCELPWHVCYQIIKGICLGLNYLHARNIIHLDLKPENILLDDGMVPKIADFGLSRLLGEGKTHLTTKRHFGTMGYMAPEYIDIGEITFKSDIYSLGVIIREMVMGRSYNDARTDLDVPESWVIRLIKESSKMRQTQWEIGYQQIKACIEISDKCTKPKPKDRPSTLDILNTLEEKDVVEPTPNDLLELPRFGPPWAGDEGRPRDITKAPDRLDRITIRSGHVIDAIDFSYTDRDGQYHTTTRPWGGHGGGEDSFQLGPLEFLTAISGVVSPYCGLKNVITSLTFVTNARSYGPFGRGHGKPFHIQVQSDGCWIVGLFGRSNKYLHALGVYTNQEARIAGIGPWGGNGRVFHGILDRNEQQDTAGPSGGCGGNADKFEYAKFGPWGGGGGSPRDIEKSPYRLHSVTIRSGVIIDSIEFSYTDRDGEYHTTGAWGGHGGSNSSIKLGPFEYIKGVFGSIGDFYSLGNVITSLTFVTNARSYGPFGTGQGRNFHIPMLRNGCIVGFFGRSGLYLDAIGVYTNQELEIVEEDEGGVTRVGPWGADGGVLHDIVVKPHHLERVTIFSGTIIDSLEFSYSDDDGNQHIAGPWGGNGGGGRRIRLGPEEFIVEVSGTIHPWGDLPNAVYSLTLVTNTGTTYGPFGTELGAAFHIPVQSNSRIVGFFAHGNDYIEGIGAYIRIM